MNVWQSNYIPVTLKSQVFVVAIRNWHFLHGLLVSSLSSLVIRVTNGGVELFSPKNDDGGARSLFHHVTSNHTIISEKIRSQYFKFVYLDKKLGWRLRAGLFPLSLCVVCVEQQQQQQQLVHHHHLIITSTSYIYIYIYSNHHYGLYERIDGHEWWSTGDGIHLSHFETE